jgi:hypothetical protein
VDDGIRAVFEGRVEQSLIEHSGLDERGRLNVIRFGKPRRIIHFGVDFGEWRGI